MSVLRRSEIVLDSEYFLENTNQTILLQSEFNRKILDEIEDYKESQKSEMAMTMSPEIFKPRTLENRKIETL